MISLPLLVLFDQKGLEATAQPGLLHLLIPLLHFLLQAKHFQATRFLHR